MYVTVVCNRRVTVVEQLVYVSVVYTFVEPLWNHCLYVTVA